MSNKISSEIAQTFKISIWGFVMMLWHSILLVPRWITVGLPALALVLFIAWLWYNFFR
jgi:hypothetical protein